MMCCLGQHAIATLSNQQNNLITIPFSSTAEQRAVNSKVPGSNPGGGANREDDDHLWSMAERNLVSRLGENCTRLGLASLLLAEQGFGRIKAVLTIGI